MDLDKILSDNKKLAEIKSNIFHALHEFTRPVPETAELKALFSYWDFQGGDLYFRVFETDGVLRFTHVKGAGEIQLEAAVWIKKDPVSYEQISKIEFDLQNNYKVSGNVTLEVINTESIVRFLVYTFYNKI